LQFPAGFLWRCVRGVYIFKGCFKDAVGQVGYGSGQAVYCLEDWVESGTKPVGCWVIIVIIIVVLWMQVPDQHWLMVVGMLVVSDSRQFGVPGGARVGASWIYRVCVFMMGAGRVCRTVWYFKRVIGCRVSIGFVRVWRRRRGVEGAAVVGNGVGEGHCAYAGFELSKVDTRWWWSER